MTAWTTAPAAGPPAPSPGNDLGPQAQATYATLIQLGFATDRRNLQVAVGASGLGVGCDRRLAYAANGTRAVNRTDPMKLIVGTSVHMWLAAKFAILDAGSGRFLIECPIEYGGVPGTCDLYDRFTRCVVDWKTTSMRRLADIKRNGISRTYLWQIQVYAAGLAQLGEEPARVALVFIPTDGTLDDIWAWVARVDPDVAERAVRRLRDLEHRDPATVPASPDRLCPWCDYYNPASTDLASGCPGKKGT